MGTIQTARQVIADAEVSLRDLISKALAEQRYADVSEIADLADRVAQLLAGSDIQLSVSTPKAAQDRPKPKYRLEKQRPDPETKRLDLQPRIVRRAKPVRRSPRKRDYPKFVRDDDRLVKVGWSRKNSEEYEHRVPRKAVVAFLKHLANQAVQDKIFDIDGLFPVRDASGQELPGYQVYVIVAWLREANVIEKKGRDGYVLRDKNVLSGEINELWNSLRERTV